jgi:hypothetical protein
VCFTSTFSACQCTSIRLIFENPASNNRSVVISFVSLAVPYAWISRTRAASQSDGTHHPSHYLRRRCCVRRDGSARLGPTAASWGEWAMADWWVRACVRDSLSQHQHRTSHLLPLPPAWPLQKGRTRAQPSSLYYSTPRLPPSALHTIYHTTRARISAHLRKRWDRSIPSLTHRLLLPPSLFPPPRRQSVGPSSSSVPPVARWG